MQGYINEISLLNKFRDCETIVKLYDAEVNKEKGYIHMVTFFFFFFITKISNFFFFFFFFKKVIRMWRN